MKLPYGYVLLSAAVQTAAGLVRCHSFFVSLGQEAEQSPLSPLEEVQFHRPLLLGCPMQGTEKQMKKVTIIALAAAVLFLALQSQYTSIPDNAAHDLENLNFEEYTDAEKLQAILNQGPSFGACSYRLAWIDSLPFGPTDAIISGYLYYCEEDYTSLTKDFSWSQYSGVLYFDVDRPLYFSQAFTQRYAPAESSIRFFQVANSYTIYFEGIF